MNRNEKKLKVSELEKELICSWLAPRQAWPTDTSLHGGGDQEK
jgi:hypothetical protein